MKILNVHAAILFLLILYLSDEIFIQMMCISGFAIHLLGVKRFFKPLGDEYVPSDGKLIYRLAKATNGLQDGSNLYWWTFLTLSVLFWIFSFLKYYLW